MQTSASQIFEKTELLFFTSSWLHVALLGLPPPDDAPSWLDPDPTLLLPDLICSLAIFCIWRSLSSTVSSWESLLSGDPSWEERK